MRTLLSLSQCHGELLTSAWHPILITLQVSFVTVFGTLLAGAKSQTFF